MRSVKAANLRYIMLESGATSLDSLKTGLADVSVILPPVAGVSWSILAVTELLATTNKTHVQLPCQYSFLTQHSKKS